jgi:hypothetical protein
MAAYPGFVIPTRQKTDLLFGTKEPLAAGGSRDLSVAEVAGYNAVSFFGFSDQPFAATVEESCSPNGPFVQTATLLSSAAPGGGQEICARVLPCAAFMKVAVGNLGPSDMKALDFCGLGIPLP